MTGVHAHATLARYVAASKRLEIRGRQEMWRTRTSKSYYSRNWSYRGLFVLLPCLLVASSGVDFYDIPRMYENEDQQEDSVSIVSSWMLQKQKVLQGNPCCTGKRFMLN
jgi:hypothetical protein